MSNITPVKRVQSETNKSSLGSSEPPSPQTRPQSESKIDHSLLNIEGKSSRGSIKLDPRLSTISIDGSQVDKYNRGAYLQGYVYVAGSTPSTVRSSQPADSEFSPLVGSTPTTGSSPPAGSSPSVPLSPSNIQARLGITSSLQSPPSGSYSPSVLTPPSGSTSSGWTPRESSSERKSQVSPSQLTERQTSSSGATTSGSGTGSSSPIRQNVQDGSPLVSKAGTPTSSHPKTPIQWPWRIKKPRWRRGFTGVPPSSFHLDVDSPNLYLVERSIRIFTPDYFSRAIAKVTTPKKSSDYHNESGAMLLWGSANGRYVGDVLGGLPHGRGQHWIPNPMSPKGALRLLYDGEWDYGMKTGYGCLFHSNKQEYRGEMKNGEQHGQGCIKYKDGSIYCGNWCQGRKHGIGTYYYINEGCYTGAWKKDQRDGWGVFYWPIKRRKWEGEWVNDFPYSGAMSPLEDSEYHLFNMEDVPKEFPKYFWTTYPDNNSLLPIEFLKIKRMKLRHPSLSLYSKIAPMRKLRDKKKHDGKLFQKDFQEKLRGNLPFEHLDALKHAFHKLAPGYMHRTILHGAQIRSLINVARIDPDMNEGQQLALHLEEVAKKNNNGISFNNLLYGILSYHYP